MLKNEEFCYVTITVVRGDLQADYRILLDDLLTLPDLQSVIERKVGDLRVQIANHKKTLTPKPKLRLIEGGKDPNGL